MILLIDNYDSFTHNLAQMIEIQEEVIIVRNDDERMFELAEKAEGIIISPGPGKPKETGYVYELVNKFYKKIPILGICLGHQALGELFGSQVVLAGEVKHGKRSQISCTQQGLFEGLAEEISVMRYHSLVIARENFGQELTITAVAKDDEEIMAFEHKKYPIFGIQFHPESIGTPDGMTMIQNFILKTKEKANGKITNKSL